MTAVNAYSPNQTEAGQGEARVAEPSMEDILASIRRIIADDQLQGGKPAFPGAPRRPPAALAPAETPEVPAPKAAERPGSSFEEVLDLARVSTGSPARSARPENLSRPPQEQIAFPPQFAHDEPEQGYDAPLAPEPDPAPQPVAPLRKVNGSASILKARLPEPPALQRQEPQPQPMTVPSAPAYQDRASGPEAQPAAEPLMSPKLGASVMSAFETLAASVVLQNSDMLDRIMRELLRPMLKTWLDDNLPTLVERLVRAEIERVARGGRG